MSIVGKIGAELEQLKRRIPGVTTATITGVSPLRIRGASGDVLVQHTYGWPVSVGDLVLVVRVGSAVWAIGPVSQPVYPAGVGTVTGAAVGGLVPVLTDDGRGGTRTVNVPGPSGLSTGSRVGLSWAQTPTGWVGHITTVLSANPTGAPAPPPPEVNPIQPDEPPVVPQPRDIQVKASDIRTWRDGKWRGADAKGAAYQGRYASSSYGPNHGFWAYGPGAFDTLRGLEVTSVEVWMRALGGVGPGAATPVYFRMHDAARFSSSYPALSGAADSTHSLRDNASGWLALPPAWGQDLVDGVRAGLAVVHDGSAHYGGFASLAADGMSGAIRIKAR